MPAREGAETRGRYEVILQGFDCVPVSDVMRAQGRTYSLVLYPSNQPGGAPVGEKKRRRGSCERGDLRVLLPSFA